MELELLGPLRVTDNGSELVVSGPKRRALLTLLALHVGTPLSRDRIVEALWPLDRTGREESTLRVHVSHIRDVLETDRESSPSVVLTRGSGYMLDDDSVEIDVARFDRLARDARAMLESRPDNALGLLNEALALWRGRPLQDVEYEEFAQDEIRRLERVRVDTVELRAEALIGAGNDAEAVDDLQILVHNDPGRERSVILLMTALYRSGRHAESLRVARRHARHLAETGLEPSPQLTELEGRILQHDPTLLPDGAVSTRELTVGSSIRGYELREIAGSGSIGVVFKAYQSSVGREVAFKAIRSELAESSGFVQRFADEARVVATLEHPHIVPLHDFWRDIGGAFLVMRWMNGGSLAERLESPMPEADLAQVFSQLSEALAYSHSAGVVHRDVKPANVMFDEAGNAYLCDFGMAAMGVDMRSDSGKRLASIQAPYASPEALRGEPASIATDIYGLGVLFAEAASGQPFQGIETPLKEPLREVVRVATAPDPTDRYPDVGAFRRALLDAVGPVSVPTPRRVRRNPYQGLDAFEESDRADFYGRDDVVESLLDMVAGHGIATVIGASGSGKSSVVKAGLIPELRHGALPGSEDWAVVQMVPATEPFEEFHLALREVAVGEVRVGADRGSRELLAAFNDALEGPSSQAVLVIDQFEELFSVDIDDEVRVRFLDNLHELAALPNRRFKLILTLRADFSDRPLSHPTFGNLISRSSLLLAPMHPEQIEDVIRRPAARVGIDVEPGLIAEVIRDVSSAASSLPLLQYVLTELFERRSEDRLTVQAYRELGGVHGVLERRAEAIVRSLSSQSQEATRQLFLRMVQLGEHGEETRRRLPLTEVAGLGSRAAVEEALDAFSDARILTYDRDPVSRTPTVEVAHETVIQHWPRLQVWIDDARTELRAHRRLHSDAIAWQEAAGDPEYLLSRGPLATAVELLGAGRLRLNELETTYVNESLSAEAERQDREEQVEHRSQRRLRVGIGATVVAALIGVLAVFAFIQRQRADELAQQQVRQSTARSLAVASLANLDSSDPDLSLLLAIEGAEQSLRAGEPVLPEVVDALHRAIITPRPDIVIEGARAEQRASVFAFAPGGVRMAMLADGGGASVVDPRTGETIARIPAQDPDAFGIDFRFDGAAVLTVHADAVRQWDWRTGEMGTEIRPDFEVWTATYSRQGTRIAVGGIDGTIEVYDARTGVRTLEIDDAHDTAVAAIDFDPHGSRLISGGRDTRVRIWDLTTGDLLVEADTPNVRNAINDVVWHPLLEKAVVATGDAITLIIDTQTGSPLTALGNSGVFNDAVAHDATGTFSMVAGRDGMARAYGTALGGEVIFTLPTAGVPLRDIEVVPGTFAPAVVGVDGKIRIYRDLSQSEKPAKLYPILYPRLTLTPDGSRYVVNSNNLHLGLPFTRPGLLEVVDVASGESVIARPTWRTSYTTGRAGITHDGSTIAFVGPSGDVEIVDVESGATVMVPDSLDWANDLDFSPDGRLLAGASIHGSIAIWDRTTGETIALLKGHGDRLPSVLSVPPRIVPNVAEVLTAQRVDDVVWLEDSARIVSAGYDGTVRLWDVTSGVGEVLYQFEHEVFSVALDTAGSHLVAADRAGNVVEIDPEGGGAVRTLEPLSSGGELSFSPDGTMLAGTGPAGVTVWDMATGRVTRQIRGSVYPTTDAVFINGGRELRVSSGEGMIRGYYLDPQDLVAAAKAEVTRSMTDEECGRYLGEAGCES